MSTSSSGGSGLSGPSGDSQAMDVIKWVLESSSLNMEEFLRWYQGGEDSEDDLNPPPDLKGRLSSLKGQFTPRTKLVKYIWDVKRNIYY